MESNVLILAHPPQRNGNEKDAVRPSWAANLKEEQGRCLSGVSSAPAVVLPVFMVLLETTHFHFLKDLTVLFLSMRM